MLIESSYYIFYLLILLISTSTRVYGASCRSDVLETSCNTYHGYWCCSSDEYCDSDMQRCLPRLFTTITTSLMPSSENHLNFGIVIIIISIIVIFVSLYRVICVLQQRQCLRSFFVTESNQRVLHSNRQQPTPISVQVVYVRPVSNVTVAPPSPNICETPPPSYEAATANLLLPHPSASLSPSMAETAEQTDSRVHLQ